MVFDAAAESKRYCLFPIRYPVLYDFFKRAVASYWTVEEVDLSRDLRDWAELQENERSFIKNVLAFFAGSDGIVAENLMLNFYKEVHAQEARSFWAFQAAIECVHSETYSLLIDTYVSDPAERERLFDAVRTVPCVARKAEWALKHTAPETASFAERLLAFSCVEGVHFSGSFCAIFWLKSRGRMPGLCMSNEFIARDEALHTAFSVEVYRMLPPEDRLPEARAHEVFREAVDIEREFITESIPCSMLGMNSALMSDYVEFVADRLLAQLGYEGIYGHRECPFDFMELISMPNKTNFFEGKVSEYTRSVGTGGAGTRIDTEADF